MSNANLHEVERGAPLVVFDLDGTLSQSHLCIIESARRTLDRMGLPQVSAELVQSLIGEQYDAFFSGIAPGCSDYAAFERAYTDVEYDVFREQGQLYPGVPEMLAELRSMGCAIAMLSNGSVEYEELVCAALGIREYFDVLESGSAHNGKTAALRLLMQRYQRPLTVMVGDRKHDIDAAEDNDACPIAALYGYGSKQELKGSEWAVDEPREITGVIEELLRLLWFTP